MGVLKMIREHLGIVLGMNIPFFIVLTKLDISPKNVTERTIKDLKELFVRFSKNKKLKVNKTVELVTEILIKDIISNFKDNYNKIVPIFPVSSVSGEGITCVREFITGLEPRKVLIQVLNIQ